MDQASHPSTATGGRTNYGRARRALLTRQCFRRSSVVEHRTVNPLVAGSNPAAGARTRQAFEITRLCSERRACVRSGHVNGPRPGHALRTRSRTHAAQAATSRTRRGAEYRWRRRVPARHSSTIVAPVQALALRAKGSAEAKEPARRLDMLSETAFALMESVGVLDRATTSASFGSWRGSRSPRRRLRAPARSRLDADLALQREASYRETLRDAYPSQP